MRALPVLSPVLAAALAGCWWTVPAHDDGDEAFAAQAIEAILGRKPHGSAEVSALADLVASHGRAAAVDVLFEEPEYVAYWSQVLADDLEVQRAGASAIDPNCAAPALLGPALSEELAGHLASEHAAEEFCVEPRNPVVFSFTEDEFWRAFDAAAAEYPYTPVTKLPEPEPLRERVRPPPAPEPGKEPVEATRFPDLRAEGAGASNANLVFDDGLGDVPDEVDQGRFSKLRDAVVYDPCPPFNLTDVIEAAVRADRLDAAYRAYLPVMATFPGSAVDSSMRRELGAAFLDVYLDRDLACMSCHTATYSTTDARPLNGNWDRFYAVWYGLPVPLDAEGTVFSFDKAGGDFDYGGDGGTAVRTRTNAFFRRDNHVSGGLRPWGFDETCVTNPARGFDGFDLSLPTDPTMTDAAFAGLGPARDLGVVDLTESLSHATATFDGVAFTVPDWDTYRTARGASFPPAEDPPCQFCHEAPGDSATVDPAAPLLANKVATLSDQRLFSIIRNGSGQMPRMTTSDDEAWDWVAWVRVNYPHSPAFQMVDRDHAFLYLVSATIVQNVVDEVLGEDVAMLHRFPRNPDQANTLSTFAMNFAEAYSLKDLLRAIVLSDAFNRQPPEEPGTEPYILPMIPYPEAAVSPLVSSPPLGANANSEGDFVHKVSPAGLFHQVNEALGWPAPPIAGDPVVYPTQEQMTATGRYTSRTEEEREHFGIDTFLAWETAVATCRKPEVVRARDVDLASGSTAGPSDPIPPDEWVDWIDLLVAGSPPGETWADLAIAVKDRLLADPSWIGDEEALLADLWGLPDLTGSPTDDGVFSPDEEDRLRDYCGMLMATPDFRTSGHSRTPTSTASSRSRSTTSARRRPRRSTPCRRRCRGS